LDKQKLFVADDSPITKWVVFHTYVGSPDGATEDHGQCHLAAGILGFTVPTSWGLSHSKHMFFWGKPVLNKPMDRIHNPHCIFGWLHSPILDGHFSQVMLVS